MDHKLPDDRTPVLLTDQQRQRIGAACEIAASIAGALDDNTTALHLRGDRLLVLGDLALEQTR
ncbi:MAG TPA: hypothetical protein VK631_25135 [Solirubrobacteraceae bacterium]|nr:hypothetical protein [Solirubrobacteraceae bacterium]